MKMATPIYHGWSISFRRNAHMYSHDLFATQSGKTYRIPCEDSAHSSGLILIWPYELGLEAGVYDDLLAALREWAASLRLNHRLYVTKDRFEPNIQK